jgi:adenosylcobinamide-phosphate synthase
LNVGLDAGLHAGLAAGALAGAWALDTRFGEPRNALHPVAWFGRVWGPVGQALRRLPPAAALVAGALAWALAVGSVVLLAAWLQAGLVAAWGLWALPALALLLKPSFAWRMLTDEVSAVDSALGRGLDEGRAQVARLCSRDVSLLDATAVRETAIETLAENFNDSLVAPLFWFVVAGLPGAWAWRAVNTLDAMWGYRGPWEWAGKWVARADDAMAWLPARLAALLLWRPAQPALALGPQLRTLARAARQTPSPNGGWPMAALALRLGVRLGKPGVYTLHAGGRPADAGSVARALQLARGAAVAAFGLALGALLLRGAARAWG